MIIKVCGMRDADNIKEVEALGVDWMGFIFYPHSQRYVGDAAPAYLPSKCKRVGVMVNSSLEEIVLRQSQFGLDFIQLHGDETPQFCASVKERVPKAKLIKVFRIKNKSDLNAINAYEDVADYFLFETKTNVYGGSGQQFDWSLLRGYQGVTPFLLTGGIGPDDAVKVHRFSHPRFVGVDINSRFELAPALKDVALIRKFLSCLRGSGV